MSGYDNPYRVCYSLAGLANATLAAAAAIRVPTHLGIKQAAIEDINLTPTTAVVNTTGPMVVQIGTNATSGKFAAQNVGTTAGLAVGAAYSCADVDGRVAAYTPQPAIVYPLVAANKGFIDLLNDGDVVGTIPTFLKIGTVVGTGTPSGVVEANILIKWW